MMTDDIDTTKIDVDPDLFGEFPTGPIELVSDDYEGLASAEQQHAWNRQVTLVDMIDACVYCDGAIRSKEMQSSVSDTVVKYKCTDCGEAWVHDPDQSVTSHR